jgi:hypothetical protein
MGHRGNQQALASDAETEKTQIAGSRHPETGAFFCVLN